MERWLYSDGVHRPARLRLDSLPAAKNRFDDGSFDSHHPMAMIQPTMISRLLLVGLLLVFCSCRAKNEERAGEEAPLGMTAPLEPVENSGRMLAGVYVVESADDSYAVSGSSGLRPTRLAFDHDGTFRRTETTRAGTLRTEAGAYVIGTGGEFVLYVEEVGGNRLAGARSERYVILAETADSMTLQQGSRTWVLRLVGGG